MPLARRFLVQEHNPHIHSYDPDGFLSVGNGNFTYTVDCTGLQSYLHNRIGKTPLCTMSSWGMHSYRGKETPRYDLLKLKQYDCNGRKVGYMTDPAGQEQLFNDLRINPHRFNLARIGLKAKDTEEEVFISSLAHIDQSLDLYSGLITSTFAWQGERVCVQTVCHPHQDQISISVESLLIANGLLSVVVHFPYASHTISGSDYTRDDDHTSILATGENNQYVIKRSMDSSRYEVHIGTCMQCCVQQTSQHAFEITCSNLVLQASFLFKQEAGNCTVSSFAQAKALSANHWARFWTEGAFIDFSLSSDERSKELQRRMLLSRYLLAIQCSGETPPPETGLTCNSWYGKFHLEMHLLHASHFALFNQAELLERSLHWYAGILDGAYERARVQGYRGARWPKMTDPSGNDSPSSIGTLLCWQQPHPIFYASLLRKTHPESALLKEWTEIIEATAAFMVDYLQYDEKQGLYVLGPPLIPVQENHRPEETLNPTFELSYWRWALQEAVSLLKEADRSVDEHWLQVLEKLSPLPNDAEVYLAHQHCPDTYGAFAYDHPSLLFSLGLLDGRDVDRRMMNNSLDRVLKDWKLNELWGWDFPLMAMTAARLGRSADAVDLLLMDSPKNTYTPNGHNAQLPKADLPLYLPGNGALLLALALMAGGWEGETAHAPGFPKDGWVVRIENLKRFW